MSYLVNYLYDIIYPPDNNIKNIYHICDEVEDEYYLVDKKIFITKEILGKTNLKPVVKNTIKLKSLHDSHLSSIMNIKLKPTPKNHNKKIYEPRHPVLKEMVNKIKIKY